MGEMAGSAPLNDDLLAHREWLTRLAAALVGDAGAEDVVQDTYEVALAKPPAKPGPLRPWLGGVARNLARMATRGRRRRERREQALPEAAEPPSPEEVVARAELYQRIGALVLELPEPLRSTVLLRYVEGMSAADIARSQGIPGGTVRARLKDALDRIRATLDTERRERGAWVRLLVPLPAALAGGLLVKTKIVIVIVLIAVVVAGTRLAGLWGGGSSSEAPQPAAAARSPAATTPVAIAPASSSAASPREQPVIHDDDPRGTLRLEGQVIDERDAPVAGATVAIDSNPPLIVETEADGAFVFEGLIRRDYRLEATADERYAGPARLRLGDKPEPVTLRLRKGGTLEVAVTERATGAPVAGAEVELRSALTWKATTDSQGIARVRGVGAGWAPLAVRAPGFAPNAVMVSTSGAPESAERVAVVLARGAAISGRVIDEAGKPIAGARVVATNASEPLPVVDPRRDGVVTGTDGAFAIAALSAGTWRLTATAGERAPVTSVPLSVDGEHARRGVELVMTEGAVVRGTVLDATGAPVAGAEIRVVARGFVDWRPRRQAFSGTDGTFAITGLARRAVEVVAWHDSGASAIAPVDLAATPKAQLTLALDVKGAISGTVVDRAGQPLGDAQVIAEPDWSGGMADRVAWSVRGVQQAVTDQGGAFRFAGLPDGAYRLRAARPGASEAALDLASSVTAKPGDSAVKIVVAADGRITGKLQLPDATAPLAFSVALGSSRPVAFSSKDGAFALPAAAGSYPVTFSGFGFVTIAKPATVTEGKDTDLGTITVNPGRSISGRVVDETGVPVAKATVAAGSLLTGGGAELYIKDESIGAKDTETDADGRFVLDGFPPSTLTVVAGKANAGRSASIQLPAGPDSATLELRLGRTTKLTGKVTRAGAPVADTVVIANPIGAVASNFFVTTGPDGAFTLDALAPGAYIVYPMLGEGGRGPKDMYTRRVDLALGASANVAIDATPGPVSLAVTVKTDKGGAVPGAQLIVFGAAVNPQTVAELRDGTNFPFSDRVIPIYLRGVAGGSATIEGMTAGPHTLCALLGDPRDPASLQFRCSPATLGGGSRQTATVVVPHAWVE